MKRRLFPIVKSFAHRVQNKTLRLVAAVAMFMGAYGAQAQLAINSLDSAALIDFNSTVTNVHTGSAITSGFFGGNFSNLLNSNAWSTRGWSDGDMAFGATAISSSPSDYFRGTATGSGVSTGGVYAFLLSSGNYGLGVQPGGSDFTPGSIVLRMTNGTGDAIDSIKVTYDIYVRNDQARANSFNFSHSDDDNTYTAVSSLDYTSTETASGTSMIVVSREATFPVSWSNGNYYYLSWDGDDVSGGGSRDEFAIDNITVTARQGAALPSTVAVDSISDSVFCVDGFVGDSIYVHFSSTGTFNGGNIYTAELSDASGSFASSTTIGSLTSTANAGSIASFIPAGTIAGTGYQVRVASSDPDTVSVGYATNLIIGSFPTASLSETNVSCNGAADGNIDLAASGGTTPYMFAWSNAAVAEDITGLSPGTYTVTLTDSNGCAVVDSASITEPTALSASVSATDASCNATADGAIDLTVSGGTTSYTFAWSTSASTEDVTGLTAGTYTVTVTDANGCTSTASATVSEPTAIDLSATTTNASCGGSDGEIDLTVSGGAGGYTFSWSNTTTTEDLTGLPIGTYTVTVTDASSCTATAAFNVSSASPLTASASVGNATCNGDTNGSIDQTVSGGTMPYSFVWSSTDTTEDLTNLAAGSYTVTITDSNNCQFVGSYSVTQPAVVGATASITNASCNGDTDGAYDLSPTGGTGPYTYLWSTGSTSEDSTGLAAGTYTVTITDANACTGTFSATITEPTVLSLSASETNVSCNGLTDGAIDLSVTGGTTAYSYSWTGGSTLQDQTGLSAGTYSVTVTDANACTATDSYTVTEPTALSASGSATDVSCNGDSDGAIDVTVSGGTTAYTFNWSNSASTEDLTGLTAGTYTITVTDANGCTDVSNHTVNEPAVLSLTASTTNVSCNGGSDGAIDLTVSGGTTSYSYAWSNSATTEDLTGLNAGTYTVTVTDANGCTATDSYTLTEPTALAMSATETDVTCNGGSDGAIDLSVSGGTTSYTYAWSNSVTTEDLTGLTAGTYTITVTDANGCTATSSYTLTEPTGMSLSASETDVLCNGGATGEIDLTVSGGTAGYAYQWTGGATTEDINGLTAGTYTVTVTDANGCTATDSYGVDEPNALALAGTTSDVACNAGSDGEIDLSVTGGTAGYTHQWSGAQTTEDLTGLTAGMYAVTVTDANGCTSTESFSITEPTALTATGTVIEVSCPGGNDGAVDLSASGGTSPYAYAWSNSATTEDVTGLTSGPINVTVTDDNGCEFTDTYTVTEPDAFDLTSAITDANCNASDDGAIDITITGGTSPYTYVWSNTQTTEDVSGLTAGTYTVTIMDDNGCSFTPDGIAVAEPTALSISFDILNVLCASCDGEVDATLAGGTEPYTYNWSNSATAEDIIGLVAGEYVLTVTDDNGCELIDTAEVLDAVGVEDLAKAGITIQAYPNPFSNQVSLTISGMTFDQASSASLHVRDLTGKLVLEQQYPSGAAAHQFVIRTGDWAGGMYFYQVVVGENVTSTGKLIKQ